MKKATKKTPSSNQNLVVMMILTQLASGFAVRFEWSETRFELQIGKLK